MKNLTVISGGLVYSSDPKFFAQKTYFFYHFPLWDFGLSFWGKLFRQKLEVFPPFWDSKISWTNHIYTSNVILGWRSLKWESWYRLLWCALQILLYPAAGIFTSAFLTLNDETFKSGTFADPGVPLVSFLPCAFSSGCQLWKSGIWTHLQGYRKHLRHPCCWTANKNALVCHFLQKNVFKKSIEDRNEGAPGAGGCLYSCRRYRLMSHCGKNLQHLLHSQNRKITFSDPALWSRPLLCSF